MDYTTRRLYRQYFTRWRCQLPNVKKTRAHSDKKWAARKPPPPQRVTFDDPRLDIALGEGARLTLDPPGRGSRLSLLILLRGEPCRAMPRDDALTPYPTSVFRRWRSSARHAGAAGATPFARLIKAARRREADLLQTLADCPNVIGQPALDAIASMGLNALKIA
jgi:hypothetical protein